MRISCEAELLFVMSQLEQYSPCTDVSIHFFIHSHYHRCLQYQLTASALSHRKHGCHDRCHHVSDVCALIMCYSPALPLRADGLLLKQEMSHSDMTFMTLLVPLFKLFTHFNTQFHSPNVTPAYVVCQWCPQRMSHINYGVYGGM